MSGRSFQGWFEVKKEISVPQYTASKLIRKNLSKRLRANQLSGRYIHIMDNDMFDSVKQMFKSKGPTDKQMAKDIVWSSKLTKEQIDYFITYHYLTLV